MAGTTTYYGISYPTSTDYVKDGATAMQTIADGFDSAVAIPTYNNQTGTSYTFVLADAGKTVTSNNASAVTFTIPPQASVAWANNTTLTVRNLGAGVVTIAGGAGVTVTNTAQTVAQYGEVKLIRTASNAWTVVPASGGESGLTKITTRTITGSSGEAFTGLSAGSRYRVVFNMYGSSIGAYVLFQFREGSTNKVGSYLGATYYANSAAAAGLYTTSNPSNDVPLIRLVNTLTNTAFVSFDLGILSNGDTANIIGNGFASYDSTAIFFGYRNEAMSACDGFYMFPNSGTLTGTLTLYKYQD